MRHTLHLVLAITTAAFVGGCAMIGNPNQVKLGGMLSGQQEVPPVATSGAGSVEATFDRSTNKLAYRVNYSGLSGPATMGHFHGPAEAGRNAGVVHGFANAASPIQGEATLTAAQAADLLAGRWYVNIHTARHPGGEIRAQVTAK